MSETLLNEIRASRPAAPSALRERVRALSVREPEREPILDRIRFTWGWRRLVLVAPAAVAVALVAGGVIGLTRGAAGGRYGTARESAGAPVQSTLQADASTHPADAWQSAEAAPPVTRAVMPAP